MFAAKIAPKQCCLQKIFFKAQVVITSGIDDMLAQIVIFRLAVNNQSWIRHWIQNGHLPMDSTGCILDANSLVCILDAAKHDLIILFGSKAI